LAAGDLDEGLTFVRQAVALYRGEYLADPTLDLPAEVEQTRQAFRLKFAELCYQAAQQARAAGQEAVAAEFLGALIRRDPWELEAYRQLAEHHERHGHAGLAQRCRQQLTARRAELDLAA
jgi:DNA-binding SARP family transcriptional activator